MVSLKKTLLLILIVTGIYPAFCQNKTTDKVAKIAPGSVTVNEFEQKLNATVNAQLLDVRTPEEYASGHLQHSKNIDFNGSTFDREIATLDKRKPTFVYCLSGGRSAKTVEKLKALGFKEVYEMQGGMRAWNAANKPLEAASDDLPKSKGLSLEEYNKQVKSDKLVLVDFNAPWCLPCRQIAPLLEEVQREESEKLQLLKINADDNQALTQELYIENIPTLILYKNGKKVWKHVGLIEKPALVKAIRSH